MEITNIAFNPDSSLVVTKADGSTATYTSSAPVVQPEDNEVDIVRTDGSVQKFVKAQ